MRKFICNDLQIEITKDVIFQKEKPFGFYVNLSNFNIIYKNDIEKLNAIVTIVLDIIKNGKIIDEIENETYNIKSEKTYFNFQNNLNNKNDLEISITSELE